MMRRVLVCAVLLVPAWAGEESAPAWPAAVPGFVSPAPGEHPRLFFRRADLPELKRRAATPEGEAIVRRLRVLLGGGEQMPARFNDQTRAYEKKQEYPVGTYSISHAAGFGMLYQLTGDRRYASLGRECFEKAWTGTRDCDPEARYAWVAPGGMLRAGPTLGWYALGYDLCHDGWEPEFRAKVAAAIQNYSDQEKGKGAEGRGESITLERLACHPKHPPGSNHYGAQVGGAALALLAIRGDAGTDNGKVNAWLAAVEKNLLLEMTKGWGDHGWFAEGEGPAGVAADTALVPAFQAMRVAGGRDFLGPRPHVPWMTMKWVMLTRLDPAAKAGRDLFPLHSNTYDHNVYARTGLSGSGHFAQGFGAVTGEQRPALLWLYDKLFRASDDAAGAPCDTVSPYPHRAILALVNWPFGATARNPSDVLPHAVEDRAAGHYMFRNRWQDAGDIIVSALLRGSKGHYGVNGGGIIVWGLGEKTRFPVRVSGDVKRFHTTDHGGVLSTSAGSLGVDFSGRSGADALIVLAGPVTGRIAPVRRGKQAITAVQTANGHSFIVMSLTEKGDPPAVETADHGIKVGTLPVRWENGDLRFGE